jgi:hypothetical protein
MFLFLLNTGGSLGCRPSKILFVELDRKNANWKQESCSLMHSDIQFENVTSKHYSTISENSLNSIYASCNATIWWGREKPK